MEENGDSEKSDEEGSDSEEGSGSNEDDKQEGSDSEKGEGEGDETNEGDATAQASDVTEPSAAESAPVIETQPAQPEPTVIEQPVISQVTTPEPPPPVVEEIVEEVVEEEEEEVMEPEVVPEFLRNVDWELAKPEDFELFEYEPLVEPVRRLSELEILTEEERDAEWMALRKENRPPVILTHLTDRVATPGSTIKLTLSAEGPGIVVTWFKNEEPLDKNPRLVTSVNCGLYTLTITDVTRKDKGVYTAEVKNRLEKLETSAKVTVVSLPKEKKVKPLIVKIRGKHFITTLSLNISYDW